MVAVPIDVPVTDDDPARWNDKFGARHDGDQRITQ